MGIKEHQVDFPRGGAETDKKNNKGTKRQNTDSLYGDGKKKVKPLQEETKKDKSSKKKNKDVWTKSISLDLLCEGVFGLGIVREIYDDYLLLETSDNCRVRLPATQIGRHLTNRLKAGDVSIDDVFTVGQMICFRITKAVEKTVLKGKKTLTYPTATSDPTKLNSHLVPSQLVHGLVLHAIVESAEEKGYVLDIGLQYTKGYLPLAKTTASLQRGYSVMVRIESSTSRIVTVSHFVEQDTFSAEACEKLHLNQLMPGTILECDPIIEEQDGAGVYVLLGNGLRGFVARRHLPPRLRADPSRLVKSFRSVVMFCQQNSNLLVLCAHPDIVAVSKPEKRSAFEGVEVGDTITCTVIDLIPSKFQVIFSLPPTADGKPSLVTATSSKTFLNKAEECEKVYKIGSVHQCRVMDFRLAERTLVVSTRKDILKQKMVSYKDAVPGDLVKAKVVNPHSKGVNVKIYDCVNGFMPLHLVSDKTEAIDKKYPIGKEFTCRIFNIDNERKQVTVTAKQSLVKHKGAKISTYSDKFVGKTSVGIIVQVFPSGALLVVFYDGVAGVLPSQEAKKLGPRAVKGKTVEVKVESVDVANNKMQLLLSDQNEIQGQTGNDDGSMVADNISNSESTAKEDKKYPVTLRNSDILPGKMETEENVQKILPNHNDLITSTKSVKNFKIYTGVVIGAWDAIDVKSRFCVKVKLPGGHLGRLHISEFPIELLTKSDAFSKFLKEHLGKKVLTRVIGFTSLSLSTHEKIRIAELTAARDKLEYPRIRAKILGYKQKYKIGETVKCFISSSMKTSHVKVELSPEVVGTISREKLVGVMKHTFKNSEGSVVDIDLPIGTLLYATVEGVSKTKSKLSLTLSLNESTEPKEKQKSEFIFGQQLTGRVVNVNHSNHVVLVQLTTGQQAILGPTGISDNYERVKEYIKKFEKGELYHFYALRRDEKPRRYHIITEGRYRKYQTRKENDEPTKLLSNLDEVASLIGQTVYGFICFDQGEEYVLVEIGPGIRGKIRKSQTVKKLPLNSIISAVIKGVDMDKKMVKLSYQKIVHTTEQTSSPSSSEKNTTKRKIDLLGAAINDESRKKLTMEDPGFDWSNTGFTPDELASIGKMNTALHSSSDLVTEKSEPPTKKVKSDSNVDEITDINQTNENFSTDEDFDRMLRKDPNSADVWIKYMSYFLEKGELEKAREIAERSFTVINYREEAELFNIWTAYLNLEVAYGDATSTKTIFDRACGNADSLKIHKQMASIFIANDKISEADDIFNAMVRKFRASSDDVWYLYADHLMSTERSQEGRDLLQRALASVPKGKHAELICRFGQLEYQKGDAERGRTLFESLITAYPKKTDLWLVYADLALKYSGMETARQILERACNLSLNAHKLRPLFKKWMDFEEKYGDEQSKQLVCTRAQRYLESQNFSDI